MHKIFKTPTNRARLSIIIIAICVLVAGLIPLKNAKALGPTFVQSNSNEIASGTINNTTFSTTNTAGNLIVAYVVWSSATSTTSVSDTQGNTYTNATSVTKWNSNKWSSQIFYAKNIKGGSNTVKATFSGSISSFGILYIHEYSGIDTANPLDVSSSAIGTANAMNSGSVTTTNANDLIFGAGASKTRVTAAGSGFTSRSTAYGNLTEDKSVSAVGSYNATATQNSNAWVMQIAAFKAAPPDTSAPSVPTNLTATATSATTVDLNWSASTDTIGVTGYKIYRDGNQVGTSTGTTFTNTGLTQGTTYTYNVAAVDAAGNTSAQSSSASATTPIPPPDTQAPSIPQNLTGSATTTQVNLTWSASTDNVAVAGYHVFRNGSLVGSPTNNSYLDTGLISGTTYNYTVSAYDAALNESAQTTPVSVTTNTPPAFSYPVSTANRKLIDQNGQVYVMKTMSSWALAQNGTNEEITSALEGVKNLGFNAVTVNPNGSYYGGDWDRYHNIYGQPFFTGTPLASPLGSGWSTMDWIMSEATRLQMTVVFSFYPGNGNTQGMGTELIAAGNNNAYNYGRDVATRYAQYPNIVWHYGADMYWGYGEDPSSMMENIAKGVSDVEGVTHRIKVAEPVNGQSSYAQFISQEGPAGQGYQYLRLNVNSVYSYGGSSVDQFDAIYNEAGATAYPVWDCEPPYINAPHYAGNKNQQQRERNYSTYIRGGVGLNYGHEKWWPTGKSGLFDGGAGWLNVLNEVPQQQVSYTWSLVDNYIKDSTWVPDNGAFLKTGLGSGDTRAASGYSQTSAIVYFPSSRSVVVNTNAIAGGGPVRLRWLDPMTGAYTLIADNEARNTNRTVSYPANHSDGTSDWVLVVDLSSANDTQAPTTPTNVSTNAVSSNQINLTWTASTDNIAVAGYKIFRDGALVGTATSNNYSDTGLSANTTYNYTVSAYDYANNQSSQSVSAAGTTLPPDTTPPTAPTNLVAGTVTGTTINLSWTASTDNTGVSSYSVYRNGALVGIVSQTQFTDTGLSPNTTYSYYVIAADYSGNTSDQSAPINATTSNTVTYATPAFVQINYATPQTNQFSVNAIYSGIQTGGNTNIVAIGWSDTTSNVTAVTDSKGNVYQLAGTIVRGSGMSQGVYYAKNITGTAAGTNTVTVTFNAAVPFADLRIAEYSGLDKNSPFDSTAAASGSTATANSGNITTTISKELIFGAGMTSQAFSATPINGFTTRVVTQPDTDIIVDKNVTTTGNYSASANQNGQWLMQVVGFKAAPQ